MKKLYLFKVFLVMLFVLKGAFAEAQGFTASGTVKESVV